MPDSTQTTRFRFWLWLIRAIGVIVPRRLRADWRQEWEAELGYRESLLADWDRLDLRHKLNLLWRSTSAFWDALWLQPHRLENQMFQDLRYGARLFFKNPGFTSVVILTLAFGIGANAALFSVVNGVLLNPLPYPEPDQLVMLHQSKPNFDAGAIPYPNFRDWQRENQTFSAMAINRGVSFSLTGTGEAERVGARLVSADFFTVLGVQPMMGRNFTVDEDQAGRPPVVLITSTLWQRKFAGAPDVIGQAMALDDKSFTIIGVLPTSYTLFRTSEVYALIGQWNAPAMKSRTAGLGLHGVGRLKPGVTLAQAQADLEIVMGHLIEAYPDANRGNGARIIPLKEQMVGHVRLTLLMLLGAVGFVLLIACVNVSNLLLARSTGRMREFAIRSALGAGQWRMLRQLFTESMLLACVGGVLGLLIASWGTKAALSVLPTALPRADEVGLDTRVLLFTLGISMITGLLSGLAPALKSSQWRLSETLKEGARGAGGGHHRAHGVLVAVEMALAVVLLIGAGLMIRSLTALWKVDPGFRPENAISFGLNFPPSMRKATEEAARANVRDLSEKLNSIPGVRAASFSGGALPLQNEDDLFFWIEGQRKPASTSEMHMALIYRVEPGYLTAMGIPLKQGRFFTYQDDERSRAIVAIDEVFARQYFPNVDPIGKRINIGDDRDPLEIVGVVGHVNQWSMGTQDKQESLQAQLYEPFWQAGGTPGNVGVVIRTEAGMAFDAIRRVVREQNDQNVIYGAQTLTEVISGTLAQNRFSMILLDSFAIVALLLATIGIYGVISYLVGQRTHEIGVRLALGAQRGDVLRLVLNQGMKMVLSGVGLGLIAAFALTRLLTSMLFGVSATDPLTFTAITVLLTTVALLACCLPARRAAKVDPLSALRHE